MRYIDNRHLKLPDNWLQDAEVALEAVRDGTKRINDLSEVWRRLKDPLADLSNGKCWYCECQQERSDDAVDHFRPKNRVKDTENPHDGYWWLAFDKDNYRYSCTFCNSRRKNPDTNITQGKGDSFPLIDEGKRGYQPDGEIREEPALLDPCKTHEPGLLDFLTDGTPCPKYPKHKIKKQKAIQSIFFYHLDHPDAIEARRKIAVDLDSWIKEGDQLYEHISVGNPTLDNVFAGITRNIIGTMNRNSPYSAFARRVVMGHRDKEWIEDLFQSC